MKRLLVLAVLLGLLLTSCVSLPTGGPIRAGGSAEVAGDLQFVRPIANPPQPGMGPLEIVEGFLAASAGVADDYQIARLYLTAEAAQNWDPGAGALVYTGDRLDLQAQGDLVVAQANQAAAVSPAGVVSNTGNAAVNLRFELLEVAGQWRISVPPPGLVLSSADLQRSFQTLNAYYLDPTRSVAVPDARLLPRTGPPGLATILVDALLAGASAWLAPAVTTAFPADTFLTLGAVPVSDGVARVDLSGQLSTLSDSDRVSLGAQLAWTLRQVPGVTQLEVTLAGRPFAMSNSPGPVPLSQFNRFDPDVLPDRAPLYGIGTDGRAVAVEPSGPVPLRGDQPDGVAAAVAIAPVGSTVAYLAPDRASIGIGNLRRSTDPLVVLPTAVAGGLSIDQRNRIWWVRPDGEVQVSVPPGGGGIRQVTGVPVQGSPGPVAAVRPSRDGTRAVVLVTTGAGLTPYLAVITGPLEAPALTALRPFGSASSVADVAWHSASQVTLLRTDTVAVVRVDLLGEVIAEFAATPNAFSVTDAPADPVVLGVAGEQAKRLLGSELRTVEGLAVPVYPG